MYDVACDRIKVPVMYAVACDTIKVLVMYAVAELIVGDCLYQRQWR